MLKNIKKKFISADGTLSGKMVAASLSLLVVLIQQILATFGIKFTGDIGAIVACINTVLAFLGLIGVLSEPATLSVDTASLESKLVQSNQAIADTKTIAVNAQESANLAHAKIDDLTTSQVNALDQSDTQSIK
ncbi:hypothetical protein [Liquorilactobacillus hordei]|uniref:hypothetical protein n=1 Tax=Liquorilactobacillus hordei TaxID=468911 RepID=UPI0039ED8EAB